MIGDPQTRVLGARSRSILGPGKSPIETPIGQADIARGLPGWKRADWIVRPALDLPTRGLTEAAQYAMQDQGHDNDRCSAACQD